MTERWACTANALTAAQQARTRAVEARIEARHLREEMERLREELRAKRLDQGAEITQSLSSVAGNQDLSGRKE